MCHKTRFTLLLAAICLLPIMRGMADFPGKVTGGDSEAKSVPFPDTHAAESPVVVAAPLDPAKIEEIIGRIKHNESLVSGLRVQAEARIRQRTGINDDGPELKREIKVNFSVDESGRLRSLSVGGTPGRIGTTDVIPQRIIGTFDGTVTRILQGRDQYERGYIGPDKFRIPREVDPRNYLHQVYHELLSTQLEGKHRILGIAKWKNRDVVLIEPPPTVVKDVSYKSQVLLDPQLDYSLIARSLWSRHDKLGPAWHEYSHTDTTDFKRSAEGVWLPSHGLYTSYNVNQAQITAKTAPTIAWQYDVTFQEWEINPNFADTDFTLDFPPGIFIQDDRKKDELK